MYQSVSVLVLLHPDYLGRSLLHHVALVLIRQAAAGAVPGDWREVVALDVVSRANGISDFPIGVRVEVLRDQTSDLSSVALTMKMIVSAYLEFQIEPACSKSGMIRS